MAGKTGPSKVAKKAAKKVARKKAVKKSSKKAKKGGGFVTNTVRPPPLN
jgi:hypothetical protein